MSNTTATLDRQDLDEAGTGLATSTESPRRRTHRVMRLVTSLMLAVAASLGVGTVTATPANAASYVEGCFRSATPGMGFAGSPVNLQAWNGSQWVTVYTDNLGSNGCTSVNIVGDLRRYYVRLNVSQRVGTAYFYGVTPYYANPGDWRVNLGTGIVSCTGCR